MGRLTRAIVEIPNERIGSFHDLAAKLASNRRSEYFPKFARFQRKESCRVSITTMDIHPRHTESVDDLLGRVVGLLIAAIPDIMLRALYDLAVDLASHDGDEWHRELKRFLKGEECWEPAKKEEKISTHYLFDMVVDHSTRLMLLELVAGKGTPLQIFSSLRGGRLDQIALLSRGVVEMYGKRFINQLSSIPKNHVVFFLFLKLERCLSVLVPSPDSFVFLLKGFV